MKPGFLDTLTTRVESLERRMDAVELGHDVDHSDIRAAGGDNSTESTSLAEAAREVHRWITDGGCSRCKICEGCAGHCCPNELCSNLASALRSAEKEAAGEPALRRAYGAGAELVMALADIRVDYGSLEESFVEHLGRELLDDNENESSEPSGFKCMVCGDDAIIANYPRCEAHVDSKVESSDGGGS